MCHCTVSAGADPAVTVPVEPLPPLTVKSDGLLLTVSAPVAITRSTTSSSAVVPAPRNGKLTANAVVEPLPVKLTTVVVDDTAMLVS